MHGVTRVYDDRRFVSVEFAHGFEVDAQPRPTVGTNIAALRSASCRDAPLGVMSERQACPLNAWRSVRSDTNCLVVATEQRPEKVSTRSELSAARTDHRVQGTPLTQMEHVLVAAVDRERSDLRSSRRDLPERGILDNARP